MKWIAASRISGFGRAIGGSVIGIKKDLAKYNLIYNFIEINGFTLLKVSARNIIFTIIPQYIRSGDWTYTLNQLEALMNENTIINPILIGDLNVRIGNLQQIVDNELLQEFYAWKPTRKSKDLIFNSKGRQLLNFCNDYGLFVLNGCSKGDEDGNFTFISGVGQSVNDICSVAQNILKCLQSFTVEPKTWSDHLPICLTLDIVVESSISHTSNLLPKLLWHSKDYESYRHKLNQNLQTLNMSTSEICLQNMTDVIKASAPSISHKTIACNPKSKWFNSKCYNARKKTFKWLRKYQKTSCASHKEKYLNAKATYKLVEKEAKQIYSDEIDLKIKNVKSSKDWWKLAREINDIPKYNTHNISAENFRLYFQNLLNPPLVSGVIQFAPNFIQNSFLDREISLEETISVLKKAKLNKAPGEDRVPYEFFKYATEDFLKKLTSIYNILFEKGNIDKSFVEAIIFPIHKKGDINQCSNYRGISFMNVVAKILMGILTDRLYNWVEQNNILNEYQAGFRKGYSTIDNIFNLSAIVNLKMNEGKKVYAFFVDFKAAFDNVLRISLFFKLNSIGVSTKYVQFVEAIYRESRASVWSGVELSDSFCFNSGVKQGCLLSPLLFALYLNDLHDFLEGGVFINNINIRLLMYADDIVILADDVLVLKNMISKLEEYCTMWNLEVNLAKSEIMIFRNGGRLASNEKWFLNGQTIKIVSEYKYLGVLLTPKMIFTKHVELRNKLAKVSINTTWNNFLGKTNYPLSSKWNIFNAVSRAIQTYGAQVWGFSCFELVDSLQIYFLKRVLKLPQFTPTYILMLETGVDNNFLYSLSLHFTYIFKALFDMNNSRLPNILSKILLDKNLFCFKEMSVLQSKFEIFWNLKDLDRNLWNIKCQELINKIKFTLMNEHLLKVSNTNRIYKYLDITVGVRYINNITTPKHIMWIFKARSDLIELNATRFSEHRSKLCSLCNIREDENIEHFLGKCPVLKEYRILYFGKIVLTMNEIIFILNEHNMYKKLVNYIINALEYRKTLIDEFNY